MNRETLTIEVELRITTAASVWLVRPRSYLRLPRGEHPREPLDDLDGATRDAEWHNHEGAWLIDDDGVHKLNVLPAGRLPGARGLISGPVQEMKGR